MRKEKTLKLKRLIVENFKGVRSQEFTFSDVTHIIGENGSGKSTLLYIISGMDDMTAGNVIFDGKDLSGII